MVNRISPPSTNGAGAPSTPETVAVASSALAQLDDVETAQVITAGMQTMSADAKGRLIDRLAPDQTMTNDIWRWIVRTFAIVLIGATAALIGAVFVSFWHKVDTAMIQIVLTVFTTTAGILAGFVSGRMSRAT
jgi:hypothetical protein